ncbi:MBL fold metallo-hydrolase [Synechococcus sp. BA-124 BA4]|uniref:MBL fold metallo-hydrolase n=1 Tax=unclassified Synechococcus TaxID=2626047 RepID=UPI002AD229DD|nr:MULTISPECIES: MBL fold metallo-hydrolase [unclassified Synechococcus]MEA5401104.1 MBL fold metallo-hydrolase [Synechococcus sp. BA-124 BA4]
MEVRTTGGTLLILDCGSGVRELGNSLMATKSSARRGHILISHLHWDHIQGMPFFAPLYAADGEWDVYAPRPGALSLQDALTLQMSPPFFPISLDALRGTIRFHELREDVHMIGDAKVSTQFLNHPGATLGYRIEADGAVVVYICDHEPHGTGDFASSQDFSREDRRHIAFLQDADLVIHDAQYIAKEFDQKRGWGHSVGEYVVEVCRQAGVRKVALTHHDPTRTDAKIDASIQNLRTAFAGSTFLPDFFAAAEGAQLDVGNQDVGTPSTTH